MSVKREAESSGDFCPTPFERGAPQRMKAELWLLSCEEAWSPGACQLWLRPQSDQAVGFTQSCLTLCDSMDCSPPGCSVHGILQARILEWVAFPSPRDCYNPGIEPRSLALQADFLLSEPAEKPLRGQRKGSIWIPLSHSPSLLCVMENMQKSASIHRGNGNQLTWELAGKRTIYLVLEAKGCETSQGLDAGHGGAPVLRARVWWVSWGKTNGHWST